MMMMMMMMVMRRRRRIILVDDNANDSNKYVAIHDSRNMDSKSSSHCNIAIIRMHIQRRYVYEYRQIMCIE